MSKNINIARTLRRNFTDAEKLVWKHLRSRELQGFKFRRQVPIGIYIVDFVCFEKRIVIEVDGGQHATAKERDERRDMWLKEQGFMVLRFWNNEVLQNIDGVLEVIRTKCLNTPHPDPLPQGEREGVRKPFQQGEREKKDNK